MYHQPQGSTVAASMTGFALKGMPEDAPAVSEFERESSAVEANLSYLEERLQVLERRLMPVLSASDIGESCAKQTSMPSSQIGSQLRIYSNRAESAASRVNELLVHLALP